MSATNRGAVRKAGDFYPTPDRFTRAIVRALGVRDGDRVLEPSAGSGAFVRAVREVAPRALIHANEPFKEEPEAADPLAKYRELVASRPDVISHALFESFDPIITFTDEPLAPGARCWIIGNPPFTLGVPHVRRALLLLRSARTAYGFRHGDEHGPMPPAHLAFLLRAGWSHPWSGGAGAGALVREHPPVLEIGLTERPSFTGGGTDGSEYAVFVWRVGDVPVLPGETRKAYLSVGPAPAHESYGLVPTRESSAPASVSAADVEAIRRVLAL